MATTDRLPAAVLFDRDGTLVVDVPYNADPDRMQLMPGAEQSVRRLRAAGVRIGMVSNQSGIGRGILTHAQVGAVNRRVQERLGAFDVCVYCPHTEQDRCDCRKPQPGLVLVACDVLGTVPARVIVIGDTAADIGAAAAAGTTGILVPNPVTRRGEIRDATHTAPDLLAAVDLVLTGAAAPPVGEVVAAHGSARR